MTDVAAIVRLRSLAQRLERLEVEDAAWFAACLAQYTAGAALGLQLDDALGLRPGPGCTSWWEQEACAKRDELLRVIAKRYFGGMSVRAQAQAIVHKAAAYEAGGYRQHRKYSSGPAAIRGSLRGELFALLKTGAPLSEGTVRRVLAHEPALFVSQASGEDPAAHPEEAA